MKHIYIIDEHQSSKQNGVGTYIRQLLKCFEGSGHDVNLLSFNSDEKVLGIEKQPAYTEYHIPAFGMGGFLHNGQLALPLLRLYIEDSNDNVFFVNHFPCDKFLADIKFIFPLSRIIFVIHDQGWCAPLFGDVEMFKKVISKKHLSRVHKDEWKQIRDITHRERRMYKLADAIIALSNNTYDLLLDTYDVPKGKIHLIPNGLQQPATSCSHEEKALIRKRLGITEDEIVLLYTGRTSPSKGIIPLLRAFDQLWLENPMMRLVIAGEVFRFNEFAKHTPNSAAHVTYTGLLPKKQLAEWYQIADIGILPSYTEQSSYTGIEMLAYGKLIVTTDGHNLKDMFNGETAVVAHIGAKRSEDSSMFVSTLTEAIQKAMGMNDLTRFKLQQNARAHYERVYSFSQWKNIYARLING